MRLLSKHFYLWSSRFDWLLDVHRHSNRVSITAQRYSSRIFSVFSRSKLNKQILSRSKRKRRKKKGIGTNIIVVGSEKDKWEREREKKDSNSLETFKKARTGSNFLNPEFLIVLRPSLLQTNWRAIDHRVSESKKKKKKRWSVPTMLIEHDIGVYMQPSTEPEGLFSSFLPGFHCRLLSIAKNPCSDSKRHVPRFRNFSPLPPLLPWAIVRVVNPLKKSG